MLSGELNQGRGDGRAVVRALEGYEVYTKYQSQNLKTGTTVGT
jgi:hypothetical protein